MHVKDAHGESQGYIFTTTKTHYRQIITEQFKNGFVVNQVDTFTSLPKSQRELARFLNQYASHSDNGCPPLNFGV